MESVPLANAGAVTTQTATALDRPRRDPWMPWVIGGGAGAVIGGVLGSGTLWLIGSAIVGRLFARWCTRRRRAHPRLMSVVAWSNLLTWLVPVLGMATAVASLGLPGDAYDATRNRALGWIGITLSVSCALYGVITSQIT